ncbi:MAG: methyltransferase domain-containing protein [Bacteroidota bacterium]
MDKDVRIKISHLKLVDSIARLGTLSMAADELCLTASALSHQLKELESGLGVKIFYRIHNRLHFTAEGQAFYEGSSSILSQLADLQQHVQEIQHDRLQHYVHGFSVEETQRLQAQAASISELIHYDSYWEVGTHVLEAGCGVGAQTQIIAGQNPEVQFTSVDLSPSSLAQAEKNITEAGLTNVCFAQADLHKLPYPTASFDHIFVCFVLEHIKRPENVLNELKRVLKIGGTLTVVEGDHGSTFFYPDSIAAKKAVETQVRLQKENGGNANIGRELYPLLQQSGFGHLRVQPRQVYVDDSNPEKLKGFVEDTFTAMIQGIRTEALAQQLIKKDVIDQGIKDLLRTAEGGGSFSYTFFKAVGTVIS